MVEFKTAYGIKERVAIEFPEQGMTEQCHKKDCDITTILKKYDKTGLITHVNNAVGEYGDFTLINEYQENLNMVIKAQDAFEELPSAIRKKFGNDPGNFFEFATNQDNKQEMIELGLANAPVVPEIPKVEVVNTEPVV